MSSPIHTSTEAAARPATTLAALADVGEQSGWNVLDTARAQQFTGEIVFQSEPAVHVYFDGGSAYYAVRAGDPSLCDRLIELGVVEPAQIERGVIRVGNVENLGRLFDRDPSIDRDAVMVVVEIATDDVVSSVANTVTSSFTPTAYRHHASGVHRWFVAPSDQRQHAQLAPVGEVAQIDASVTGDLPGLSSPPDDDDGDVHIEWDQPLGSDDLDASPPLHVLDESMLRAIFDTPGREAPGAAADPLVPPAEPNVAADPIGQQHDSFRVQPTAPLAPPVPDAVIIAPAPPLGLDSSSDHTDTPSAVHDGHSATATDAVGDVCDSDGPHGDFQIVWPDGSEQALLGSDVGTANPTSPPLGTPDPGLVAPMVDEVIAPSSESVTAPLSFEMPALAVSEDNLPQDHQPEEVVDAVRRALDAIESAAVAPAASAPFPSVPMTDLPSFEPTNPQDFAATETALPMPLTFDSTVTVDSTDDASGAIVAPVPFATPVASLPSVSALESATPAGTAHEPVVAAAAATPASVAEPASQPVAGFAAPTMNDSAEAVYARAAEAAAQAGPASGIASVVFVDEEPEVSNDRSGALKRLIGSLRRK